jgi:Smg-4/UPF3 family
MTTATGSVIKLLLTSLPPKVDEAAVLALVTGACSEDIEPRVVALEAGKVKGDGSVLPSYATIECRVETESSHAHDVWQAAEELFEALRRAPPLVDADGTSFACEPVWPLYGRFPRTPAQEDPREGTIEADPLWRDLMDRLEKKAAAPAAQLTSLAEATAPAPRPVAALVQFLLQREENRTKRRAQEAAKNAKTAQQKPGVAQQKKGSSGGKADEARSGGSSARADGKKGREASKAPNGGGVGARKSGGKGAGGAGGAGVGRGPKREPDGASARNPVSSDGWTTVSSPSTGGRQQAREKNSRGGVGGNGDGSSAKRGRGKATAVAALQLEGDMPVLGGGKPSTPARKADEPSDSTAKGAWGKALPSVTAAADIKSRDPAPRDADKDKARKK